jgi:hypothetical protein
MEKVQIHVVQIDFFLFFFYKYKSILIVSIFEVMKSVNPIRIFFFFFFRPLLNRFNYKPMQKNYHLPKINEI